MKPLIRRLVAASALAVLLSIAAPAAPAADLDFGDAPDGGPTGYGPRGAGTGRFPSLLASDGGRTADTSVVWLGAQVDREADSRQVDRDRFDDGLFLGLFPCAASTAYFEVTLSGPEKPGQGKAYLNLWLDWNRDGDWKDIDRCAPEWRIRNFEIDLEAQTQTMIYALSFRAGEQVEDLWVRATISHEEVRANETGAGLTAQGEIEDYHERAVIGERPRRPPFPPPPPPPPPPPSYFGAACVPKLNVPHGEQGKLTIMRRPGSAPILSTALAGSQPAGTPSYALTKGSGNTYTFRSKRVDPPPRVVLHVVRIRVRFGTPGNVVANVTLKCEVRVVHSAVQKKRPPPGRCGLVGAQSDWTPLPFGASTLARIRINLGADSSTWRRQCPPGPPGKADVPIEIVALDITGIGPPLPFSPTPSAGCVLVSTTRQRCALTSPLPYKLDSFFDVFFEVPVDQISVPGGALVIGVIDSAGRRIGEIVSLSKAPGPSQTFALSVSKAGDGTGTVTSSPAGVSCGSTCAASFSSGASVALAATADAGSVFTGWSEACSGTGACSLTMDAAKNVTANFARLFQLQIVLPAGPGRVTGNPAGIDCGGIYSACSGNYASGATVALTATPTPPSTQWSWQGGGCDSLPPSTASCTVSMTQAQTVSIVFS